MGHDEGQVSIAREPSEGNKRAWSRAGMRIIATKRVAGAVKRRSAFEEKIRES